MKDWIYRLTGGRKLDGGHNELYFRVYYFLPVKRCWFHIQSADQCEHSIFPRLRNNRALSEVLLIVPLFVRA
jgi:hypothetical protein